MKFKNIISILGEGLSLSKLGASKKSVFLYLLSQVVARIPAARKRFSAPWEIVFRDGVRLFYRCNLGDIQSIREVWIEEHYALPATFSRNGVFIDLGANIGLTSLWLAKKHGFKLICAVEPEKSNLEILRLNLKGAGGVAKIIEAAVGPNDGEAFFEVSTSSNSGHLGSTGIPTKVLSMKSILGELPRAEEIDLVKMDIEGGEEALMSGNLEWLDFVHAIVAELHPEVCDTKKVIQNICSKGFHFLQAGKYGKNDFKMDAFVRNLAEGSAT